MKTNFSLTALVLSVSSVITGSAQAQALEEIVVTAQKRVQNVQDIPVSISVLSANRLNELNIVTAGEVAAATPNLQSSENYGETQPIFSIRGMSMSDYNTNQASPVAVYVDEAPISSNFMQGLSLFDIERVEVLRGPQGTLYGKNTTGGAINFITKTPTLDRTSGNIKIGAGDYSRKHASGAVETAFIDNVFGARLAFNYIKTDGYHKNHFPGGDDLTGTDDKSARLTLKYQGDSFNANLKLTIGDNDGKANGVISDPKVEIGGYKFDALGNSLVNIYGLDPATVAALGYEPRKPGWDAWEGSHNKSNDYDTEFNAVNLRMNWKVGNYSIATVTAYLDGSGLNSANTDGSSYRLLEIDWGSKVKQFSQDIRLTSNYSGPFNFIAGFYYDEDEIKIHNQFDVFLETQTLSREFNNGDEMNPTSILDTLALPENIPIPGKTGFTTDQRYTQERESLAIYFHSTYDVTDALTLAVGIRYTDDQGRGKNIKSYLGDYYRKNIQSLITNSANIVGIPAYSTRYNPNDLEWDQDKVTGKVGLDYKINDHFMVYGSLSRGYRASAFNGGAQFFSNELSVADPETVDAIELGFKSEWFSGMMQLNGAVFDYAYKGQQFVNVIGIQQFLVNGGKSSIRGAEFELVAVPTGRLHLNIGLGLLDTEFKKLSLYNSQANDGSNIDLSGNELFNAPEVNLNAAFQYTLLVNDSGELRVGADTTYTSRQWYSAYNDDIGYDGIKANSAWKSNANVTWKSSGGSWIGTLWVKNIGNSDKNSYAINLQSGFGYNYKSVDLPRHWGADLQYLF